ncbi:hypothetical protein [Staphylococcus aureus]|uniref:hypothetical protein n=1 Tax=Staphylococcus aureus TaxID=1280 RepID=UPI001BFDA78E|nr:hypothetical protein [Staphylococcus aureus]
MNELSISEYKALNHVFELYLENYNQYCFDNKLSNEWTISMLLEENDTKRLKTIDEFKYGVTIDVYKEEGYLILNKIDSLDSKSDIQIKTKEIGVIIRVLQDILNELILIFKNIMRIKKDNYSEVEI